MEQKKEQQGECREGKKRKRCRDKRSEQQSLNMAASLKRKGDQVERGSEAADE